MEQEAAAPDAHELIELAGGAHEAGGQPHEGRAGGVVRIGGRVAHQVFDEGIEGAVPKAEDGTFEVTGAPFGGGAFHVGLSHDQSAAGELHVGDPREVVHGEVGHGGAAPLQQGGERRRERVAREAVVQGRVERLAEDLIGEVFLLHLGEGGQQVLDIEGQSCGVMGTQLLGGGEERHGFRPVRGPASRPRGCGRGWRCGRI